MGAGFDLRYQRGWERKKRGGSSPISITPGEGFLFSPREEERKKEGRSLAFLPA